MQEELNENKVSEHRVEEQNSDGDDQLESDKNSQYSDPKQADHSNTVDESEGDEPAETNEIQSLEDILNEDGHDSDQISEEESLQVAAANSVLASRRESSPSIDGSSAGLIDDSQSVDENEVNADDHGENEIESMVHSKTSRIDSSRKKKIEPMVNSIRIEQRAKREGENKNPKELSPEGGFEDTSFDGVPMVLSSPMPADQRRNKDKKAGWRDDEYILRSERSDSSAKFQQPGVESDSKQLSSKSSELKLASSGRFASAAEINEEALQREYRNKMKAGMISSAEEVEACDKARLYPEISLKIGCFIFLIIIGMIVGLVVGLGQTSQVTNITHAPTTSPTLLDDDQYLEVLFSSISGSEVLRDFSSPQYMASDMISRENQGGTFNVRNVSNQYLSERYALRVLYYSTKGDSWFITDHNFDSATNTCAWMNVTQGNRLLCNELGEVTDLFLNAAGLNGTIPAELSVLSSLSHLSLAKNNLYGSIPSSLGDLKDMKFMQFALNQLSGSIPSTFESFAKLERFIMHVNQLTGTLPNLWGDDFRRLRINDNKLTGNIPHMPTQLPLDWFQISDNGFTGTLPKNLSEQPKLITLAVSNNRFEGTIPEQLSALVLLENLVLDGNLFHGTLPSTLGRLTKIDWFWVNDNNFSGTLPTSFQAMAKATQFKFQNNNFNGRLPSEWSSLQSLVSLDMSSNPNLQGTVPASYIGLEALTSFAVAGTRISGGLTDTFCVTQQLDSLSAECGGETPFVECPCCTSCCDQDYCALQNLGKT